jgi:hypothetical protein
MKSFHDLLLPYDASQIDRTARVTHSDPCSHTGDVFKSGRWAKEVVDNAAVPP